MEQVDFSFLEDGLNIIKDHIILLAVVTLGTLVGVHFLLKFLNVPRLIANALTWLVMVAVFILMVLYYYLPGIISGLS